MKNHIISTCNWSTHPNPSNAALHRSLIPVEVRTKSRVRRVPVEIRRKIVHISTQPKFCIPHNISNHFLILFFWISHYFKTKIYWSFMSEVESEIAPMCMQAIHKHIDTQYIFVLLQLHTTLREMNLKNNKYKRLNFVVFFLFIKVFMLSTVIVGHQAGHLCTWNTEAEKFVIFLICG